MELVARRGLPFQFPENSLIGFARAMQLGARWLSTDVRLTADGIPILYHDPSAKRLSGLNEPVQQLPLAALQRYGLFHPERFAARFRGHPVATLRQLGDLLQPSSHHRILLELQEDGHTESDRAKLIDRTLWALDASGVRDRVILLSVRADLLHAIRRGTRLPVGWIGTRWSPDHQRELARLQPDYLFLEHSLWSSLSAEQYTGGWAVGVFTVDDPMAARAVGMRGVKLLETERFDEWTGGS